MLVRLFGSNFRSLKDKFELSLVAADLTRKEDRGRGFFDVRLAGMSEPLRLLRCLAIFGPNASGKSTVLLAAQALRWLGTESSGRSNPNGTIPTYDPFLLDKKSREIPVLLGCDVVHNHSLLRYEIEFDAKTFRRETLTILGEEGEIKLIDRLPSGEIGGELIACSEANRLYVKEMQPNVAVLSKLAQHGPHKGKESARPYHQAIRNALCYRDYSSATMVQNDLDGAVYLRFADDPEYREWIMRHLILSADVGIRDVHARKVNLKVLDEVRELVEKGGGGFRIPDGKMVAVSFVHEGNASQPLPFNKESSGTRKLFNIGGDWWTLANEFLTLFADELSASLHPRLLDRLIRAVNDAPKDRRSQLIFATHDTGLLEGQDGLPPALRRDQVYFTRKNAEGASELYSLAEFKEDARPVHNIRKRYMSGLYGAIPSVEKLSL